MPCVRGFGPVRNVAYPPLQDPTEWLRCPRFPTLHLLTRQPLTSVLSPFPECHGVGITGFVAFSDWCLSPSNVRLRFLRAFSWLESSFLFSREERPTVRVDHGVFAIRLL